MTLENDLNSKKKSAQRKQMESSAYHEMEENHHHSQQQKLISNGENSFNPVFSLNPSHQYNQQQQQLPYTFFQEIPQFLPYHHPHHFQAVLQQQRRLQEQQQQQQCVLLGQEINVAAAAAAETITPSVPSCFSPSFKPDLNENIGNNSIGGDALLRGNETSAYYCWQNQEDSAIRQPLWKPLRNDLSDKLGSDDSTTKDKQVEPEMMNNRGCEETKQINNNSLESSKTRLFSELEAICGNASTIAENLATNTSTADEGSKRMVEKKIIETRKRLRDDELSSMAIFFEGLVNKLMDQQEILHGKFMETIERLDKERREREDSWRKQEMEKLQQDLATKARERALASNREASIVSFLEKITGHDINLPPSKPIQMAKSSEPLDAELTSSSTKGKRDDFVINRTASKRWPKAEVEALIQIRSSLESKFQVAGFKGPLWEEISNSMGSMGYQRSAKRCKEKWENINKYFKKSKESLNHSRKKLKTCQYFDHLDQIYSSKSLLNGSYNSCGSSSEHREKPADEIIEAERVEEQLKEDGDQEHIEEMEVEVKEQRDDDNNAEYGDEGD
ncbi:hypothetical protein ACH5RR_040157 [Cinchona calisaya]|uniref:Myb-like domain-containing protein n=1 Tax=Cinchona calisaya TaxID=153742 RepID=A0ABD2XV73_9GENT